MPQDFTYSSESAQFKHMFALYMEHTSKGVKEALTHQATNLAWDLYHQTKKHGPNKDFLMAIPERVGWRIKRPHGWAVFDMPNPPKRKGQTAKQRKKAKTNWDAKPGEMNRRAKGLGVTARGWLPKYWQGNPEWRIKGIARPKGIVQVELDGKVLSITLINVMPGMPGMEAKHGIISKALGARVADMQVYIERKLQEAAQAAGYHQ